MILGFMAFVIGAMVGSIAQPKPLKYCVLDRLDENKALTVQEAVDLCKHR